MNAKTTKWILLVILLTGLGSSCHKQVSVLVVVGGHGYDTTEFFEVFRVMDDISFDSISQIGAMSLLASERVLDYDVVAFYDFIPDMDLKDSSVYINLARNGRSMLFLHHSLCTFQRWKGFENMVGGRYCMPGFGYDTLLLSDYKHDIEIEVHLSEPDHPITKGMEDFTILDEGYSNVKYQPGITPILETDHPDSSPVIGWVNTFDQSTIVYLMLGHDKHAYSNEAFRQLLENSIHWLSSNEIQ